MQEDDVTGEQSSGSNRHDPSDPGPAGTDSTEGCGPGQDAAEHEEEDAEEAAVEEEAEQGP